MLEKTILPQNSHEYHFICVCVLICETKIVFQTMIYWINSHKHVFTTQLFVFFICSVRFDFLENYLVSTCEILRIPKLRTSQSVICRIPHSETQSPYGEHIWDFIIWTDAGIIMQTAERSWALPHLYAALTCDSSTCVTDPVHRLPLIQSISPCDWDKPVVL